VSPITEGQKRGGGIFWDLSDWQRSGNSEAHGDPYTPCCRRSRAPLGKCAVKQKEPVDFLEVIVACLGSQLAFLTSLLDEAVATFRGYTGYPSITGDVIKEGISTASPGNLVRSAGEDLQSYYLKVEKRIREPDRKYNPK
jgi:hypothetical protein